MALQKERNGVFPNTSLFYKSMKYIVGKIVIFLWLVRGGREVEDSKEICTISVYINQRWS